MVAECEMMSGQQYFSSGWTHLTQLGCHGEVLAAVHIQLFEYTGEIMFETFNVPRLYIAVNFVLALATG
ncbi:Actin-related protein 3, partial [Mucuna pruriens]